jgi:hypothetical protein
MRDIKTFLGSLVDHMAARPHPLVTTVTRLFALALLIFSTGSTPIEDAGIGQGSLVSASTLTVPSLLTDTHVWSQSAGIATVRTSLPSWHKASGDCAGHRLPIFYTRATSKVSIELPAYSLLGCGTALRL